jgi:hypothetical protein
MLLAEALAARKDALKQIEDLRERIAAAAVRYEDQDAPIEDPETLVRQLDERLDSMESLTVRINRTNNAARLTFDTRDLSIMEAIALRERLTLEAMARRGAVDAADEATGRGGSARHTRAVMYGAPGRRTKDDIRELAAIDVAVERRIADGLSESVRRLDMALQQKNWTTELVE